MGLVEPQKPPPLEPEPAPVELRLWQDYYNLSDTYKLYKKKLYTHRLNLRRTVDMLKVRTEIDLRHITEICETIVSLTYFPAPVRAIDSLPPDGKCANTKTVHIMLTTLHEQTQWYPPVISLFSAQ